LTALSAFGCGGASDDAERAERPNVVLISIDTLRADRLGSYGYRLPTSPHIDELAEQGVRFRDATVPWPRTWPAMASMLTGTYPATNGVAFRPRRPLPGNNETLAEALAGAGYATAAVVANVNLGRGFGFNQGFEHFVESWAEKARGQTGSAEIEPVAGRVKAFTNATIVTDEALSLIETLSARQPFFLWLHYMDPHGPYLPPAEYAGLWAGEYARNEVPLGRIPQYQRQVRDGVTITDLGHYEAQYDREIRYTDDEIRRILDDLQVRGLSDETLIVLTADHGESLGEHRDYLSHGTSPYQPGARVPWIMVLPGRLPDGRVIDSAVGLIDLKPTVLELVGLSPSPATQGRSLVSTIDADVPPPEFIFVESGWASPSQLAVRRGRWKLVWLRAARDRRKFTREAVELYDLDTDPGETLNVAREHAEVADELLVTLEHWRATTPRYTGPAGPSGPVDEQTREMLRALGYPDEH
jgi:arylsulfatase A-like enzyme